MLPTSLSKYELISPVPFNWQEFFTFYRFLCGNPDQKKGEGFYYRLVYAGQQEEFCLQVVLYYRLQIFPYHVNDFHPFYAYFDRSYRLKRILYDSGHHNVSQISGVGRQVFSVRYPWHGFHPGRSWLAPRFESACFDLTDSVLHVWWLEPGKPQFKLRSKFVDPWHPDLLDHGQTRGNFRDEAICPVCKDVKLLDTLELQGTDFWLDLRCRNGHSYRVWYDARKMQLTSQVGQWDGAR